MNEKWFAPVLPYLAVWMGLFLFKSAWAALIGLHIAFLCVLAFYQSKPAPIHLFKSKKSKWIVFNLLLCGPVGLGIYYLHSFVGLALNFKMQLAQLGLNTNTLPAFIAYFSLVNPFLEEYFWRSFFGSGTKGFYIGDLLYASYHVLILINKVSILATLFSIVCLTFIGWFWRQSRREDQGQLAAVLGHMAADFSVLTAVFFLVK